MIKWGRCDRGMQGVVHHKTTTTRLCKSSSSSWGHTLQKLYQKPFSHFHLAQPQPRTHTWWTDKGHVHFFTNKLVWKWMDEECSDTGKKKKKWGKTCGLFLQIVTCDVFEASVAAADRHGGGLDQTSEATHPVQSLLDHQTSVVRPRIPRGRAQRRVGWSRLGRGRGCRRVIAFHHFFSEQIFWMSAINVKSKSYNWRGSRHW